MKKIIVLGGGTAGWLTALFANKAFPNAQVKVIENKSLGIIGVGEATTPPIVTFLKYVGIDPIKMIKEIGGTIKNGISFENWNGDGKKYFHGFKEINRLDPFSVPPFFGSDCMDYYLKKLIEEGKDFNEYVFSTAISYENKVDVNNMYYALHFDTNKLSDYLELHAASKGIELIDGNYKNVKTDENGFIKTIVLDDAEYDCDFVFDCTGFARLLIGKHFNTSWKSYEKHLPLKRAIPFFLESEEEIKPYTSAIAMKYGWMWRTPLQNRIGNGYVFDTDYIDEHEAQKEVEEYFGRPIKVNKVIDFNAGRYEQYWVKNCIATGLASSFVEPIESSSIHMTISQLMNISQFANHFFEYNQNSVDSYNKIATDNMDQVLNFIYLHYITKREDTEFWKNLQKNYPPPENFKHTLQLIKENNLRYFDTFFMTQDSVFTLYSYYMVANGLEIFEQPINNTGYEITPSVDQYKYILDEFKSRAINHKQFLSS